MKKLMMNLGLFVLSIATANVFADKALDKYKEYVAIIKIDQPMDQKKLSMNELCYLKRYITSENKELLNNLIKNMSAGVKRSVLIDFRSYIDYLIKNDRDYLLGLKGEIITAIKKYNPNASCLK